MVSSSSEVLIKFYLERNIPFCALRLPNKKTVVYNGVSLERPENQDYVVVKQWDENSKPVYFKSVSSDLSNRLSDVSSLKRPRETSFAEYAEAFNKMFTKINDGLVQKVILSRIIQTEAPQRFSPEKFYKKLCLQYPTALCAIVLHPEEGLWIEASPEILVKSNGASFTTISLAGTRAERESKPWEKKEINEQELVSKHIRTVLKNLNATRISESDLRTRKAGPVTHLETQFDFEIPTSVELDTLLSQLHPTPAISGLPIETAKRIISETETHQRRLYCGYTGHIEDGESTNFFVNLRCMQVFGNELYIYVGGGITKDSNLESEWNETTNKAKTLTNLIHGGH